MHLYERLCSYHAFSIVEKNPLVVGTINRPDPDTISEKHLEVDIVKAWSDLDRSLIAEGLISGLSFLVVFIFFLSIKEQKMSVMISVVHFLFTLGCCK